MKIAILGFTKVKYMPYMNFYLDQIDTAQHEVHLIYWKRDDMSDSDVPQGVEGHEFDYPMSDAIPLTKKVPGIMKYGKFAKKALKKINPDFLIVLHSTTAISIYGLLKRKYKGKYIFDYRDITYENISIYRRMVATVVNNSALSFTSSDGFRKWLPETSRLLTSHNISNVSLRADMADSLPREKHTPIRIAFWGLLRGKAINQKIIDKLGGDDRFEMHYYGRTQGSMSVLMEESMAKYSNVYFHGEYFPEDRLQMAKNTDVLHNIYEQSNKTSSIAMGNKYYDGVMFALPQLCTKGSLMGTLCTKYSIGLECDPFDADFADKIYEYYTSLDEAEFTANCDRELERVLKEVEYGNQKIKEVLHNV
ncbi:MAG: hypothetical protein IJX74_02465 [Clostridia bacterium]|nr:hypothetical protein [Clostridia bacterium]